jgi:hypothetical protein
MSERLTQSASNEFDEPEIEGLDVPLTAVYEDGYSVLEYNKPGAEIDFDHSKHKYFKDPLYSPSEHILICGQDSQGNSIETSVGMRGAVTTTEGPDHKTVKPFEREFDVKDALLTVRVGEAWKSRYAKMAKVESVASLYKVGPIDYAEQRAGNNPFADRMVY